MPSGSHIKYIRSIFIAVVAIDRVILSEEVRLFV